MSSFQLPPQLQNLKNINVPPQVKAAQAKVEYYVAQFDKQLEQYPALVKLEQATHVPKSWGTLATIFVLSTAIFFNIFASFFTNILGFGLPAYLSLRALESPAKDDDVQWLTYWVSFGYLTILESFSPVILYYVPAYYTFKSLVLLWLMLPQTQGSKVVYAKVLHPLFFQKKKALS